MHCTECHSNDLVWKTYVDEFGDLSLQEGEEWDPSFYETAFCLHCNKEVKIIEAQDLFIFLECLECGNKEGQCFDSPRHHLELFRTEEWPFARMADNEMPLLECLTCNGKHIKVEIYDENKDDYVHKEVNSGFK